MQQYIVLFRGINVGLKNRIAMSKLRECLEQLGCSDVVTYINSGNVLLASRLKADKLRRSIEETLPQRFHLDDAIVRVLVLTFHQLETVIDSKPQGFGEQPELYFSDVIFLLSLEPQKASGVFRVKEGVDKIWLGKEVIYSQRLGALRTKSRLNRIMGTPEYKSMTIRNWNTVIKLFALMQARLD